MSKLFHFQIALTTDQKTSLPDDAKIICLELYADKTRLSSFGSEKGYPVMARIVNLPVKIRNGDGIGGARVVGWLPVVRPNFLPNLELTPIPHYRSRSATLRRIRADLVGLILNRSSGTPLFTSY